ncbi:MAG: glycoside hydrolase family 88 protein, partial [Marinilabiliaceae bacterium]|nr:glycoside hydrolase family 88 protein [Marinilabiliaceae bacterium]
NIFPAFEGTFHWTPHLTPTDEHIISDHVFRAPAIVWANENQVMTLLPDLDDRSKSPYRWYMDLDVPANKMIIGLSNYRVDDHVLFKKTDNTTYEPGEIKLGFYVMVSSDPEDVMNPWRDALAFLWEKHGKALADKGEPVNRSLEPYVDHTYNWAFNNWKDAVWQEFDLNGKKVGAPAFIVNVTQSPNYPGRVDEREFRSVWNQAWFNSLRSAQGLYRYGRRINNKEYIRKANMTKELALSFPQRNGLFPGVIATEMEMVDIDGKKYNRSKGWNTAYFGNSNRNPYTYDVAESPLHILDMSCTAYFMLLWYEELEKDDRLLQYAEEYAKGLLKYQDEKGFFSAWIDEETLQPHDILTQSPETSMSVTFLLKLFKITGDEKYMKAAQKAMDAVVNEIIPIGQWEDFETYWSCSRWGCNNYVGKKIARNNMFKQNTLSIYWTAEALLDCYELTKEEKYLELGQRTLDELLMTQAVWQPPYMYVNVFGGFGVMNADGEWNDSRQALFAELIIRYGKLLDNEEYVQRGVAALKASFSMMYCPENLKTKKQWEAKHPFFNEKDYGFMMENYGHGGYTSKDGGGIGPFTIYDWGNGAASEAYNRLVDHYGEELFELK